jgi:hypothetical protein
MASLLEAVPRAAGEILRFAQDDSLGVVWVMEALGIGHAGGVVC